MTNQPQATRANPLPYDSPPEHDIQALIELAGLGYVRGILNKLADIESANPANGAFVQRMRELTQTFQLDTLGDQLNKALHASQQN